MHSQSAILLVDDEPVVIGVCERILTASGFTVLTAQDGCEGLEVFHLHRAQIVLIVADASMPGMGGVELARRILDVDGSARFIIMTGHGSDYPFPDDLRQSCVFLRKPFTANDFRNAVNVAVNLDGNAEAASV